MGNYGLFAVNEFAKLARVTKDALLHYDRIGLLSPAERGANGYRYYTSNQLGSLNMIRVLRKLGMSLDEIQEVMDKREPHYTDILFESQIENLNRKIDDLVSMRKLLQTARTAIHSTVGIDIDSIVVKRLPAEAVVMGGLNDYSEGKDDYDALKAFYASVAENYPRANLNYPVWAVFSEERIRRHDWTWPDRYYFYNPDGHDKRPAGMYAIGYAHGEYGRHEALCERILSYIDENGFEVCGNAYEEYPLNEMCTVYPKDYLLRMMFEVRQKDRLR